MESLVESGRQRLEGLIDAALSNGSGSGTNGNHGGDAEGGVGRAGAELMRLWEEGKEQLSELAGKGGEVRRLGSCMRGGVFLLGERCAYWVVVCERRLSRVKGARMESN